MNHQSRFFNLLSLALLFALVACQTPATPLPTETLLPTNTSIPPTNTPFPPTNTPVVNSCEPGQNIFNPLNATDYLDEIDGARFYNDAEKIKGAEVIISGTVIEAKHFVLSGGVDGTLVLAEIPGDDGKRYLAMILLPDKGVAVNQYLPATLIRAVGIHLGYIEVPPKLFEESLKVDGVSLPSMAVEIASGGCKQ